jgi:GMP synthase-like glutamine amidotransferase
VPNYIFGFLFQRLAESDGANQWHILSVSEYNGTEFISSFEHKKYPFYGVQFHPEKNAFEWKVESIPHSAESILAQQFYGNFLVNEGKLTGRRSTCTVIPLAMTSHLNFPLDLCSEFFDILLEFRTSNS